MGVGNCRIEDSASYPQKLMKNVRATFSWFDTTFAIDNNYDLYVWGNEASVAPAMEHSIAPTASHHRFRTFPMWED